MSIEEMQYPIQNFLTYFKRHESRFSLLSFEEVEEFILNSFPSKKNFSCFNWQ